MCIGLYLPVTVYIWARGKGSAVKQGEGGGVMNYELARERLQKQKAVILFEPKRLGILHLIR